MKTMIIRENNKPNYEPVHAVEAFGDILEALHNNLFIDICFDEDAATLEYTVSLTGTHIKKIFNPDTMKDDIVEYLFSMLDGVVNL